MPPRALPLPVSLLFLILAPTPLMAQSITSAADGTGTQVLQEGDRYTITGGTRAQENLFHSFERLGLNADEIATFLAQPDIENILGRVTGGNASLIDGLLQVTGGSANLYLMNPAGIVLGPNARLDLSGSFVATTATGIGFGDNWFNAVGDNTYADLVGNPDSFAFSLANGGSVVNLANLAVHSGERIMLLGGTVTNAGTLTAPEGRITLAAVPGENRVRLSQAGSLLSLELEAANGIWDGALNPVNLTPLSLPELLTGGTVANASQITINPDGTVRLGGANVPVQDGTTLVSGTLDAVGAADAEITVLGDRIALLNATLNASGTNGGGNIRIGGDYQGNGSVFNASRTFVSQDSTLAADALVNGNGGRAIVWADGATEFYGTLSAQGTGTGNGGFAEISGANFLDFRGRANLTSPQGQAGTLLLDPADITIVAGPNNPADLPSGGGTQLLFADNPGGASVVNNGTIDLATANVILQATNTITFNAPINIATAGVGLTATANGIDVNAAITTNQGDITLSTANGDAGVDVFAPITSNGGDITIIGRRNAFNPGTAIASGVLLAGGGSINSGDGAIRIEGTSLQDDDGITVGAPIQSGTGSITLIGNAAGGLAGEGIITFSTISSNGGDIVIEASSNLFTGVAVSNPINSNGGSISITGTTGNINASSILLPAPITANTGNITLTGDRIAIGAVISSSGNLLVQPQSSTAPITVGDVGNIFFNAASVQNLQDGFNSITIGRADGTGGINVAGTGGLAFNDPLTLRSPGTNSGAMTINNALTLSANNSLTVLSGGAIFVNQPITTNNGPITLTANEILVDAGASLTSNGGNITLSNTPNGTDGIDILGPIASNGGNITITGRDTGINLSDQGVWLFNGGSLNSGGGAIRIEGTGLGDDGIDVSAPISSGGGPITLIGTANGANARGEGVVLLAPINSVGGAIVVEGTSDVDDGVQLFSAGINSNGGTISLRGTTSSADFFSIAIGFPIASETGSVTLTGDRINIGTGISGTGQLVIQPETPNLPILLGGTDDTAFLSDADFARISGFTTITIGRNDATGAVQLTTIPTLPGATRIAGGSTLTGPNQATTWTLNRNNGSLTSGGNTIAFANIEGLIGNAGDDDFVFNTGGAFSGTIDAGDGTDTLNYAAVITPLTINLPQIAGFENVVGGPATTLAGSNTANTWTITGTNAGRVNGLSFRSVPSLQGGSGNDSFTLENGGQITGQILGGDGIDQVIGGGVSSGVANSWVITDETTGTLNGSSFGEFERLTGSSGDDRFQFTSDDAFRGDIEGLTGELRLTGETVNLDGNIVAQGNVFVEAEQAIRVGAIDTSSTTGNGGNVTLDPRGDIQVRSINTEGGSSGIGGTVDITAGRFFRATDTFTNRNGQQVSISTAGGQGGGAITIRHGGNGETPFLIGGTVGNNGSRAAITNGSNTFAIGESFWGSETRGTAQILTDVRAGRLRLLAPCQASCNDTTDTEDNSSTPGTASSEESHGSVEVPTVMFAQERLLTVAEQTGIPPALIYINFVSPGIALPNDFEQQEAIASQQFSRYLGQPSPTESPLLTAQAQDNDELELLLILPSGDPIRYRVREVTRAMVQQTRRQLLREVTAPSRLRSNRYLPASQQLYEWLIAPLETELEEAGIENLAFVLDAGLRSLPLAALHDGEQFLIERYSLGLMPSLSLTDTRYRNLQNVPVLAMGASEFERMIALPAVPTELETVTSVVPNSVAYLNQDFTKTNLLRSRYERPYGIVHLATHAEFLPGQLNASFIQFGDRRLSLDAIRELGLNDPPVELLVLSACRTALGDEQAELGFGGIAVQAGVRSVLASLWYISDTGTLVFMSEFYRQLQEAPTRSEALRRTQLALLRGEVQLGNDRLLTSEGNAIAIPSNISDTSIDFTHPYFWASFSMIGSPW